MQIWTNVLKSRKPGTLAVPRQRRIRRRGLLEPQRCLRKAGGGTWASPTTPPRVQITPPTDPPPPARYATLIGELSNPSEHIGAYWVSCRRCIAHFPALGARRGRRLAAIAFPPSGGRCEGLSGGVWRASRGRGRRGGVGRAAGGVGPRCAHAERGGTAGGDLDAFRCASCGPGPCCSLIFYFFLPPPPRFSGDGRGISLPRAG